MLKSAIYGFAIGDAVGVPYEFKLRGKFKCRGMRGGGTHYQPAGTWSDDTSMTLATCDSIRRLGKIDYRDLMARFMVWLHFGEYTARGKVFDVGHTVLRALEKYHATKSIEECCQKSYYDNGNGALMRMLPLAFIDCSDEEITKVASLTHGHKISTDICVEYVKLTKRLIETRDPMAALGATEYIDLIHQPESTVESSGYVVDTFNAAKWCLVNSKSYKECVLKAVNLGDDTDTVAAIAGGWAGIVYGYKNIPFTWRLRLKNKKLIDYCIRGVSK